MIGRRRCVRQEGTTQQFQRQQQRNNNQLHGRLWTKKGSGVARAVGAGVGATKMFVSARHCREQIRCEQGQHHNNFQWAIKLSIAAAMAATMGTSGCVILGNSIWAGAGGRAWCGSSLSRQQRHLVQRRMGRQSYLVSKVVGRRRTYIGVIFTKFTCMSTQVLLTLCTLNALVIIEHTERGQI